MRKGNCGKINGRINAQKEYKTSGQGGGEVSVMGV